MIAPVISASRRQRARPLQFLAPESTEFGAAAAAESGQRVPQDPVRQRVLIIEDNVDAANGLCEYLELLGHEVCVAHTGAEGLSIARELGPTLVLCDIGLPEMDGWAVARALRSDPVTAGVRLIAITGYGSGEDRKKSVEAGFEAHLTKPIDMDLLDAALARDASP